MVTDGRAVVVAGVVAVVVVAVVCGGRGDDRPGDRPGGGPGGGAACVPGTEEPLDPRSTQHLLPGAPEPEYSSDPPTSGPHLAGEVRGGALRQPLSRPSQVSVLERGGIVVQYRDLDGAARRRLESLAGPDVVAAPNPGLHDDVVATAWRRRLTCSRAGEAEVAALEAFVEAHRGRGPES